MTDSEKIIISKMLDEIIRRAAPESQTVPKYGGVLYTFKPKRLSVLWRLFLQKSCSIGDRERARTKGPDGVLLGNGKTRRHVNFESADTVDSKVLLPLLKQAANSHR